MVFTRRHPAYPEDSSLSLTLTSRTHRRKRLSELVILTNRSNQEINFEAVICSRAACANSQKYHGLNNKKTVLTFIWFSEAFLVVDPILLCQNNLSVQIGNFKHWTHTRLTPSPLRSRSWFWITVAPAKGRSKGSRKSSQIWSCSASLTSA